MQNLHYKYFLWNLSPLSSQMIIHLSFDQKHEVSCQLAKVFKHFLLSTFNGNYQIMQNPSALAHTVSLLLISQVNLQDHWL